MDTFDWKSRIREWSRKRIELLTEREKAQLPLDILESGYLGHPGVTEEQIAVVEARLGLTFPPEGATRKPKAMECRNLTEL
jgi:hypothetical protein